MPSRRFVLPRFGLPRFGLPRAARPPLAVSVVGGLLTAVIATGHQAVGVRPAAASATMTAPVVAASRTSTTAAADNAPSALASPALVARALRVVAVDGAAAGRASRSEQRAPLHRWLRPNIGPLTSPFGYRWGRLHAGIDLAGPYGSPIVAATDGCITYAGPMSGYGEVMKITDWDGTETVYGHMSAFVRQSGCVKAGEEIARVGAAGDATGPHLHFEVHVGGVPVDPIPFLAKHGLYI
ncbi:MAG: hypothetical protein QOJ03_2009 [Frankiaceae bacterium]|jgi:murein DD-endopeptidase MepM/ murein hydrolase activator NlpD|nr:hypothetical protein [Frankiaceae bacterium]